MSQTTWTWDENRQEYYYVTTDASGNYTYHFQSEQQQPRTDSPHVPRSEQALGSANLIKGTPELGSSERLDSSYWMRTGSETYDFFRVGKVFSMLHVQAASANDLAPISENITVVKYGERAFSQIRRFVVVEVRRGFVYACPISTYSKRGTLKPGCVPSQHSVVYLSGTLPSMFEGEREHGLVKQPISIIPSPEAGGVPMNAASRLHYAKAYLIEMNVKVKDIGDVDPSLLSLLLHYYREENHIESSVPGASAYALSSQAPYSPSSAYPAQNQHSQHYQGQTHQNQGYLQPYQDQAYQAPNYQSGYY